MLYFVCWPSHLDSHPEKALSVSSLWILVVVIVDITRV